MKIIPSLALALVVAVTGGQAWAADDAQHDAHHPAGPKSAPKAKAMSAKSDPTMARMDDQMKAMREMHDKMMAAQTPDERSVLMAEHMKAMQDGMSMMNGMSSGSMAGTQSDMAARHRMMEKRMEMMQTMMQMMMDRLPSSRECQIFCVRGARRLVHGGGRRLRRTTDAVGKSVVHVTPRSP